MMYVKGQSVNVDINKAKELFKRALAIKIVPEYLYSLGVLYECRCGVKRNLVKAKECYQKAADMGFEPAKKRLKLEIFK